jgi:hypothetical protein
MKKYYFVLAMLVFTQRLYAAPADTALSTKQRDSTKHGKPPVCYIGLGTGINNPSGFLGLDFNLRLGKFVTLDIGAGPGTWGNKLFIGVKDYLRKNHRGWALGGGITFSSGEEHTDFRLNTISGSNEKVSFNLRPEENAYIAVYHYWTLGKKYNRIYVTLGKSVPFHPPRFRQNGGNPVTDESRDHVRALSPGSFLGGIMIGGGISFGMYRK